MKKISFVYLFLLFSSVSYAEPFLYEDGVYKFKAENIDDCYELGTSNPVLGTCQEHFNTASKDDLSLIFDTLISKLNRDKSEFIEAQQKWEEFSKSQCLFEAKASQNDAKSYKAYTEHYNICLDKLRLNRSIYLKQISIGCTGCVQ